MGCSDCPAPDADRDRFTCGRCGTCCTNLRGLWSSGGAPVSSIAGERIYRLPTEGGLRMFSWETEPFDDERLEPLLVVADGQRERLVAFAYELDARVCPQYDDEVGCTIYEDRPLVCRAYPLLVVQGEDGPEVTASGLCPSRVPIQQATDGTGEPEQALAQAYPDEFAAALGVPATVGTLAETVSFLASADVLDPVRGLEGGDLDGWRSREVLDLVDLVEAAGVLSRQDLAERVERVVEGVRERWISRDEPS